MKRRYTNVVAVCSLFSVIGVACSSAKSSVRSSSAVVLGSPVACQDVVVIGVRESGSPPGTDGNFGKTAGAARSVLADKLRGRRSVSSVGLPYPALSTGAITEDFGTKYFAGVDEGVTRLVEATEQVTSGCRSWIVFTGYSQGALVIRKALPRMTPRAASRVAGVALFGDPAMAPDDGTVRRADADPNGRGLYTDAVAETPAVPPIAGPALSWCNKGDAVCASGTGQLVDMVIQANASGGESTPHGRYLADGSTRTAGEEIAQHVLTLAARPSV
jgi:Cutinase